MPQLAPCPDQLQLDFKLRVDLSMMTVEQYKSLSPEEMKALTFGEINEIYNRHYWRHWRMEPGNGAKMYEEYLEWLKGTPEEIQAHLNRLIRVTGDCDLPDLRSLKSLLKRGANSNSFEKGWNDGAPPLHQWALLACVEAVQLLLDHEADVSITDNYGRSALKHAAGALNWAETSKAEQVVKLIIQAGADVNVKSTLGYTPLMWAARAGNLEITQLLIELGANVHDTDNDGNNALHYARNPAHKHHPRVKQNRQATIRLLRKHGGKTGEELTVEGK